ncbi:MAG: hypothetical protein ACK5H2_02825 [Beutenbergiaceae bacterium]
MTQRLLRTIQVLGWALFTAKIALISLIVGALIMSAGQLGEIIVMFGVIFAFAFCLPVLVLAGIEFLILFLWSRYPKPSLIALIVTSAIQIGGVGWLSRFFGVLESSIGQAAYAVLAGCAVLALAIVVLCTLTLTRLPKQVGHPPGPPR